MLVLALIPVVQFLILLMMLLGIPGRQEMLESATIFVSPRCSNCRTLETHSGMLDGLIPIRAHIRLSNWLKSSGIRSSVFVISLINEAQRFLFLVVASVSVIKLVIKPYSGRLTFSSAASDPQFLHKICRLQIVCFHSH